MLIFHKKKRLSKQNLVILVSFLLLGLVVLYNKFFWNSHESEKIQDLNHLAIVMDGNRRWAKQHNLSTMAGHKKGADAIEVAVKFCLKHGIKYLTLYTFSIENLGRTVEEKNNLFSLIPPFFDRYKNELVKEGVKINIFGDESLMPTFIAPYFKQVEQLTRLGDKLTVNFLFCYGGRQEVCQATTKICREVLAGRLQIEDLTTDVFESFLWTSGLPCPDLVLRTGGRSRISNFLIWQIAYSEIIFLDVLWPDINDKLLFECCEKYKKSHRTFGQ